MLKELTRKERVSKLEALSTSEEIRRYLMYQDYYEGTHFVKSTFYETDYGKKSSYNVETRSGNLLYDDAEDEKVIVSSNWCRPVIDTIADYTRGVNEDIVIETSDTKLSDVWKNNQINTLTHELGYGAGINGKTFLRFRQENEDIKLFQVDPTMVHEIFNPLTEERDGLIYFFSIDHETATRLFPEFPINSEDGNVFYAEEWTDKNLYKFIDGILINGDKNLNPYEFIPFFKIKADVYESSDIHDVIPLNDELNINLTYINEILKYGAFPMLGPKGTFTNESPILDKEKTKDMEISPRTIMPIPMERIASGGIDESVLSHLENLKKDISIVSGVPIKLLTAELDGSMSGVALQRMMGSVLKQAEIRRNYIREVYKEISDRILERLGESSTDVDIIFPEMVDIDLNEKLDESIKKDALGVSKKTILTELGYDYDEEEKQRKEEFDNSLEERVKDEFNKVQPNNPRKQEKGVKGKAGNA